MAAAAGAVRAGGTRSLLGVPYAAIPGVRPLELDLHLPPENGTPVPVVAFLHGGGRRVGSRSTAGPAYAGARPTPFERVAQAGVAVASVDYRLTGESIWPAQLHDAKAAVRWLRARAGELGVDPDRIAAWGESAGGHLAALLGLTRDDEALEGDVGITGPSSAVGAVVAWYAPSALAGLPNDLGIDPQDPATREALLLGAPAVDVPDTAAQASPISHVHPAAPPFLLLHGAEVELDVYEDADHMWRGSAETAEQALERTVDVLRRSFGIRR